ncbi:hypothetical protein D3C79_49650 [compost metagenome]
MAIDLQHDVVVLYHKNCLDGLASAWVVWKAYEGNVSLVPVQYGDNFIDMFGENWSLLTGKSVICVDFAFNLAETKALGAVSKLLVLDHHATAWKALEPIAWRSWPRAYEQWDLVKDDFGVPVVVVDDRHSGAMLTWMWFNPGAEPPKGIALAEDYDLWRFAYPETKHWSAAAFSHELNVENFDRVMQTPIEEVVREGRAIQRHIDKTVKGLSKQARRFIIDEYDVPVVNANSLFRNELGALLAIDEPFSMTYTDGRDGRQYSLRSKKGTGVDVGEIAKRFGGGGHPNSAAFRIPMDDEQFYHSHAHLSSTRPVKVGKDRIQAPRYAEGVN